MYRPATYAVDDLATLHGVMRERIFALLAASRENRVLFAHAPVVVDAGAGTHGRVRFHLARGNPLAALEDGDRAWLSMTAADAYVSPDWYRSGGMVPTWNYVAIEGEGTIRRHSREELHELLEDISAQEEARLAPKKPWTLGEVPERRVAALMNAIVGFSLSLDRLEGKFKLSQDKSGEDFAGVLCGLAARGDGASLAVAQAMKKIARPAH
jgi:transcriptional regulator